LDAQEQKDSGPQYGNLNRGGNKPVNATPTTSSCLVYLTPAFVALCKASSKLGQHYFALRYPHQECPTLIQLPGNTLLWCVVAAFGCGYVRFTAQLVDSSEQVQEFVKVFESFKKVDASDRVAEGDSESTTSSENENEDELKKLTVPTNPSSSQGFNLAVRDSANKMIVVIKSERSTCLSLVYTGAVIFNMPGVLADFSATFVGVLKVVGYDSSHVEANKPAVGYYIAALVIASVASYNFLTFRFLKIPAGLQSFYKHICTLNTMKILPLTFIVGTVAAYLFLNLLFNNHAPAEMLKIAAKLGSNATLPNATLQTVTAVFNIGSYAQVFLSIANGAAAFDYTASLICLVTKMAIQECVNFTSSLLIAGDAFVFFVLMWNTISCALPSSVISTTLAALSTLCVTATYLFYNLKSSQGPLHLIDQYNRDNKIKSTAKPTQSLLNNDQEVNNTASGITITGVNKSYNLLDWIDSHDYSHSGSPEKFKVAHNAAITLDSSV
jgi:hypothetical protein